MGEGTSCATAGCFHGDLTYFEAGGVGSWYCQQCYARVLRRQLAAITKELEEARIDLALLMRPHVERIVEHALQGVTHGVESELLSFASLVDDAYEFGSIECTEDHDANGTLCPHVEAKRIRRERHRYGEAWATAKCEGLAHAAIGAGEEECTNRPRIGSREWCAKDDGDCSDPNCPKHGTSSQ
jgi:hypothetical protein